jgi:hypothetical protein
MEEYFGLLRGPEDWATLQKLRGKGKLTREVRETVNEFLEAQSKKALARLRRWLGLSRPPGRPRELDKREIWAVCAELRRRDHKKYTYSSLARMIDANEYENDPHGAIDRLRHGIRTVKTQTHG